jgi:hypothetical protein
LSSWSSPAVLGSVLLWALSWARLWLWVLLWARLWVPQLLSQPSPVDR